MGLVLATTFGLIIWVVLWALGAKAFDALLVTIAIVMIAATVRIFSPYLPGNRE
jgi:hypothetical protein